MSEKRKGKWITSMESFKADPIGSYRNGILKRQMLIEKYERLIVKHKASIKRIEKLIKKEEAKKNE